MKKLKITILSLLIINGAPFMTNSNAQDTTYEIYTKSIQKSYSSEYQPQEVQQDINSLQDIKYLRLKTDSNYEIALSNSDETYSYLSSCDDLQSAIDLAKTQTSKVKSNSIPVVINKEGLVVYASEGIGRIIKTIDGTPTTATNTTTNIYKTSELKSPEHTYINHSYIDDVPIIENDGNSSKIEVAGYTGYIRNTESDGSANIIVVPINQANGLSYYNVNTSGDLVHYISSDVTTANKTSPQIIGPAPRFMQSGAKYYSYDGNYFYTDINVLINDTKGNHHNNAVNANAPYYNYYQYLPGRSKTSYNANDINRYFEQNTPSDSVLRNTGTYFIKAQNEYGVNALMSIGIAMNESNKGISNIAKTKNNIFGANAKDAFLEEADSFATIEECIMRVSNYSFSNGYFNPKSWKYNSSTVGNKSFGANVRYASDPFWSEKAIKNMYQIDKFLGGATGLKDYNRYSIGMYTAPTTVKNSLNKDLYNILAENSRIPSQPSQGQVGDTTIVLNQSGGNYEMRPDRIVGINETNYNSDGTYLWDKFGAVSQGSVKLINQAANINTDFNNWAKDYVVDAMNKGWVDTTNVFNPESPMTRASFVKVVNRAFNLTTKGNINFTDVSPGMWYYDDVSIAVNAGYIVGYGDGAFRPNDPITRQEAAKIIGVLLGIKDSGDVKTSFADDSAISNWSDGYVQGLVDKGILSGYGDNTFKPQNNIRRDEGVKILSVTMK